MSPLYTFDVFLSYMRRDKLLVEQLASLLDVVGLRVWFDHWDLVVGQPWQWQVNDAIGKSAVVLICIGSPSVRVHQEREIRSILGAAQRPLTVIPVLLPGASHWDVPASLSHIQFLDLSKGINDPQKLANLIASIPTSLGCKGIDACGDYNRALPASHRQVGDGYLALGQIGKALEAYVGSLAIVEPLAQRQPERTDYQRDLSMSFNKIGDAKLAQGDGPGALEAYEAGLAIAEALSKRDPANTGWQRDLSVSLNKIGDVKVAQGDGAGALEAYEAGLGIREALSKRDPANTGWQVDVAVSCAKLGSIDAFLPVAVRKNYLYRGRDILLSLKRKGRLHANQDRTGWFDQAIRKLEEAS